MYLAIPMALALSACSVTKNMIFVNGPKDLENKVNSGNVNVEAINNMQREINYAFEKKCIPYQSLMMSNRPYEFGHPYLNIPK